MLIFLYDCACGVLDGEAGPSAASRSPSDGRLRRFFGDSVESGGSSAFGRGLELLCGEAVVAASSPASAACAVSEGALALVAASDGSSGVARPFTRPGVSDMVALWKMKPLFEERVGDAFVR